MECSDCHAGADVHGDGKRYRSMLEAGAIQADCETCHPADALPASHARNDPHGGALHCSACHAETVVSCYNCHFESQVQAGVKRALRPIHGFVLLVNRSKDGKVHPATFQTLTYGGKSFVALAPYSAHTITAEGRACAACHGTRNDSGLRFSWWNEESSGIEWRRGVVPVPEDWPSSLRMAFLSFEADPATPAGEANEAWSPLDSERADLAQMLFARPLRPEQIEKMVRPVD